MVRSDDLPSYDFIVDDIGVQTVALCAGAPAAGTSSSSVAGPVCAPASTTLSISGQSTDGGVVVEWYSSLTPGGPYTTFEGVGTSVVVSGLTATTYFQASVICTQTNDVSLGNEVSTIVIPTPTATAGSNTPLCAGDALNLTGLTDIGTTYAWSGPDGFTSTEQNPSIGAPTVAASGTYTFTATLGVCSASATTGVVVNPSPVVSSLTATPETICENTATSQLDIQATVPPYTVEPIAFAPVTGAGTSPISGDDAVSVAVPIGFSFDFFGNTYTELRVSTNGFISFDAAPGSGCCSGQALPTAGAPNNLVALAWEDLNAGAGQITTFSLAAPNRFVVDFSGVPMFGTGGGPVTSQIILYETGEIEIHNTSVSPNAFNNMTQGIENAGGTIGLAVPGRNSQSPWTATNDAYRFVPNSITYLLEPRSELG